MDESARQLELVRLTFRNGLRNCVHWQVSTRTRASQDPQLSAIGVREIIDRLFDRVNRVKDVRPAVVHGADSTMPYDHLFEVVIVMASIPGGLYVKMGLTSFDEEFPEVTIVSCHIATFSRGPR